MIENQAVRLLEVEKRKTFENIELDQIGILALLSYACKAFLFPDIFHYAFLVYHVFVFFFSSFERVLLFLCNKAVL